MKNFTFKSRLNGTVKTIKTDAFKKALAKYHFNKGWDHIGTEDA